MKRIKHLVYAIMMLFITVLLIFIGTQLSKTKYSNSLITKSGFYLDTYITIKVYDSQENYNDTIVTKNDLTDLIEHTLNLCYKYELIFSKTNSNSELYKLNESTEPKVRISKDLYQVLEKALYYSELCEGKFDVTVANLTNLWDFKNSVVPSDEDISNTLYSVDYKNISLSEYNGNYYITKNSSKIDLGGIAKGYIADKLKDYLCNNGVESGIINLGGNTIVLGDKPNHSEYNIGIQTPFEKTGKYMCTVQIKDKSIVTSGVYERMFELNDTLYHHILDPDTGYPASTDIYSATIISDKSIDGDALSTTCVLLGTENALKLINSIDGIECVIISNTNEIILSKGLDISNKVISFR